MDSETTNVDHGYIVDHVAKMIEFNPREEKVRVMKASRVRKVREYIQKYGALEIPTFDTTAKDITKLADFKARRAAKKTGKEDIDRAH